MSENQTQLSIADIKGFEVGVASAGLKSEGPDVALLKTNTPNACGHAVFTQNLVVAAPVEISRKRVKAATIKGVLVNSGNANCSTGEQGMKDALAASKRAATALDIDEANLLVCSTGIIGNMLDMQKLNLGIDMAAQELKTNGNADIASAILTTDTCSKEAHIRGAIDEVEFHIAGVAKGSGMIAPNMATMLAFICTDIAISHECLAGIVKYVTERTFNRITVDGDTSTNDTFAVLASGALGNELITDPSSPEAGSFAQALMSVASELAIAIIDDGEGATHRINIDVVGAKTEKDAKLAAKAIATSPLVKTAIAGGDPNWGRILAAAGRSGAKFDPAKVSISLQGSNVLKDGAPEELPEELASKMQERVVKMMVDLGAGNAEYYLWTCDLTKGYIEINAEYHT